jgi:hypothetical protein|tara:strand:- start:319 stop:624 length:306 start_codon:yes stop_codon:yes gene_type:complete
MSIVEQFKEGKLDLSDCMYDVFLPIVSQENTNVILFQHLSMTEEGVFRALNGLSEKDYERFDKLRKMNTGWVLANGGQVIIIKSGDDTNFISTYKSTGGII